MRENNDAKNINRAIDKTWQLPNQFKIDILEICMSMILLGYTRTLTRDQYYIHKKWQKRIKLLFRFSQFDQRVFCLEINNPIVFVAKQNLSTNICDSLPLSVDLVRIASLGQARGKGMKLFPSARRRHPQPWSRCTAGQLKGMWTPFGDRCRLCIPIDMRWTDWS